MNTVFEEDEKDLEKGSDSGSNPVRQPSPSHRRVIDSYPAPSPRTPALVVSNSGRLSISSSNAAKLFGASSSSSSPPNTQGSCISPSYTTSNSGKSLLGSYSGKSLMSQDSKKKYVQQVTGKHNDTVLHLAARRGDVMEVKRILDEINEQMLRTMKGDEFDDEVAETRASVVNETNELGETVLFTATERGFIEVVKELLPPYTTKEGLALKSRSGFVPLHIAAREGHREIVKIFLDHDPGVIKTVSQSNSTPLTTAAARGHSSVVDELLSRDSSIVYITRSNGKNALHLAAREGHVDIVNALLKKDPLLARKTDKKGQTSLHMAVKGVSSEVVRLLLQADPAIVMLPDKFSNTTLHVATR